MFSKAKIKRFNEEVGCGPSPTAYDPKVLGAANAAVSLDKSDRWRRTKEVTPGPGAYTGQLVTSPSKHKQNTSSKLNSSTCSSTSTSSCGTFLSPPKADKLARSHSMRSVRARQTERDQKVSALEEQIKNITEERDKLKHLVVDLEKQLEELQKRLRGCEDEPSPQETFEREEYEEELRAARFRLDDNEAQIEALNSTISIITQHNEHLRTLLENEEATGRYETDLRNRLEMTKSELEEATKLISLLRDERSGLVLKLRTMEESADKNFLSEDEIQNMKEHIVHLTMLRDNLESTVRAKDDLVAELQVQLDEVVVEGRTYHEQMELYRSRVEQLEEEVQYKFNERDDAQNKVCNMVARYEALMKDQIEEREIRNEVFSAVQNTFIERDDAHNKVRNMVARYESLMKDQIEEREIQKEILAKRDIEIELLNASLSNLNMKVSEYESTISLLHDVKEDHNSKILILETTISDLSMKTKEKEMMESILDEELNHRTDEVKKLEDSLKAVERKLFEVKGERDVVTAKLEEEKKNTEELSKRISVLEMHIKEKEVVQQFLEKEISSREAEVNESNSKVKFLEEDLETARQIALDLQQEAEEKLAEVIHLKASIDAKDHDDQTKEDTLTSLKDELSQKMNETCALQERLQGHLDSKEKIEEELANTKKKMSVLDTELASVREALLSREESLAMVESKMAQLEDNNKQLEEKVVELMAEISDREAEHIVKIRTIESDLEDVGVKYSESLLEHEATRRVLTQTLEQVEREKLLREGAETDVEGLKEEINKLKEEKESVESNMKDLVQKYTSLEDALACEEAENRDLEEKLEKEVSLSQEAAATSEKELTKLKTSSEGFCNQITQLKIDMRKKSQAVDEMQQCIDCLREEKLHLTTLRDNLEKTLEAKEDNIAKLHLQASTLEREMEEERVTLRSRIADLENHMKEALSERDKEIKKVGEIEKKLLSLENENIELSKSYARQIEEKLLSETAANAKLEELKKQYEGFEDQLNNLQTSLTEKTTEMGNLQGKYESCQEEMKVLETSVKRFRREIDGMNKTLASKDCSIESLNNTLGMKSEEVQSLYKTLEEKQSSLLSVECRVQQLEENEEKLTKENERLNLSMSRLETTFKEEKSAEVSRITSVLELDMDELRTQNEVLQKDVDSWKSKFQHLEKMIEPFREQLDAYEVEKVSLLSRSSAAKEEVNKLSKQYATLLGHQNHKQKIQHVLKLKTENNELREDVHKLRQETERQRKTIRRLEDKMMKISGSTSRLNDTTRSVDKENSFFGGSQVLASTPLKPSNKPRI